MNFQTGKHKMFHIFESFHLNWLGRAQKSSGKAEALVSVLQQQHNQQNAAAIAFCNTF